MNININRIVRLSIRNKLVIAFLTLSSVPLLLSGLYAVHVHTEALQKSELEYLKYDLLTVRERMTAFLKGVESDTRFLGESSLFRRFLQHPGDGELSEPFVRQILDFARNKGIYYQIRYLDGEGQEVVKIRAETRRYITLRGDQGAGGQYYLHLVEGLSRGELASSPVELTDSHGGLVAAISYVLPIFDGGSQPVGMLVLDVFAKDLFRIVEEAYGNISGQVVLVSGEGYYLYHSEKKRSWSQLLVSRDEHNVYRDYPPEVVRQIMSGQPGVWINNREVIAYTPLLQDVARKMGVYTLFMSVPRDWILAPVIQFERVLYSLLALFVVLSVVLAYLAAAQFTRPINALRAEAEVIASGEFGRRLQVETYDEIQRLAETFNSMARAVQDRELQIRRHETELEEMMEAKVIHSEKLATTGEMAAVIAHEMRNSLTSVKMILQLELEREDLSDSDREALGVAANSVRRMETVVTDLLKFARPSPPQFQPLLVNTILRESISLIQHQIRRKAIVLTESFSPDLPPVQSDAGQLKEVFVNLLLNAAQAVPEGGEITICTRPDNGGGRVEVAIEDTGPGILEGQHERIFDPFFTTKPDGTGLGLSMARRTVEAHGGKVSAANRQGGGAQFTVWLPADGIRAAETEEAQYEATDSVDRG